MALVPFGPWRPDVFGPKSGFARTAEGVIPKAEAGGFGYGPFPQLVAGDAAEALPGSPRGIRSVQAPDGTWYIYAATVDSIYELQSDFTWDAIDTGRAVPDGADVAFAVMGTKLLNTDVVDGFKAYDFSTGGANSAVSGAPAARELFVMKNVAFALGTSAAPRRFANCDIGNYTKWTGGAANRGTLEDGGALIGGADLKNGFGVMFQEFAIRGIYFGSGVSAYSINKVSDGLGCTHARTIVSYDDKVYWWAESGPWMLAAGGQPVPIGQDKISTWAATHIGRQNFGNLQGTVDPQRFLILWRLNESQVLAYSWIHQEFSILPVSTTALARIASPLVAVDSLTGDVNSLEGNIDDLGGLQSPVLGGLNLSNKYAKFTGPSLAVTLESCEVDSPVSSLIGWATPVDNAAAGTLQIGTKDALNTALTWESGESRLPDGRTPQRARGKIIALRRNIPAGDTYTYVTGVQDIVSSAGGVS